MAKPKTLREQANHAAEKLWPDLNARDGIRHKSVDLWLAGHRAGSRLTKAERAELDEARAIIKAMVAHQAKRKREIEAGEATGLPLHPRAVPILGRCIKFVEALRSKKVRK